MLVTIAPPGRPTRMVVFPLLGTSVEGRWMRLKLSSRVSRGTRLGWENAHHMLTRSWNVFFTLGTFADRSKRHTTKPLPNRPAQQLTSSRYDLSCTNVHSHNTWSLRARSKSNLPKTQLWTKCWNLSSRSLVCLQHNWPKVGPCKNGGFMGSSTWHQAQLSRNLRTGANCPCAGLQTMGFRDDAWWIFLSDCKIILSGQHLGFCNIIGQPVNSSFSVQCTLVQRNLLFLFSAMRNLGFMHFVSTSTCWIVFTIVNLYW